MALLIRLAGAADASAIAEIYRPYVESSRISFEDLPPSVEEMERRILGPEPGMHPWLAAEEDGRFAGYAASSPFRSRRAYRWSVETSVYLAALAGGRGIGRRLMEELIALLTAQGYVAAIAAIALPNDPSVRMHEALGFTAAGNYRATGFKMGQWIDVGLWQRDLAQRRPEPAEPRPFSELWPLRP